MSDSITATKVESPKAKLLTPLDQVILAETAIIKQLVDVAKATGDRSTVLIGERKEDAVKSYISKFFPASYAATKGIIYDLEGRNSQSVDCVLLHPDHPRLIFGSGADKYHMLFADFTDAAIEIKTRINGNELSRGLEQLLSVKRLRRTEPALVIPRKVPEVVQEMFKRIPSILLCLNPPKDVSVVMEHITKYYSELDVPRLDQIDLVVLLGYGNIVNIPDKELSPYAPPEPGWYFENWGEFSLGGMLLHMYSRLPRSRIEIQQNALDDYFHGMKERHLKAIAKVAD